MQLRFRVRISELKLMPRSPAVPMSARLKFPQEIIPTRPQLTFQCTRSEAPRFRATRSPRLLITRALETQLAHSESEILKSGIVVKDCALTGNAATGKANGIHLKAFGQATFEHLRVTNFPGNGILDEGANAITYISPDIEGNSIGIHNVGVVVNGIGYSGKFYKGIWWDYRLR